MLSKAIRTVPQIIEDLNKNLPSKPWRESDGLRGLTNVVIGENVNFDPTNNLVVKAFINGETAEVRLYFARVLEIENREKLWK